jgi:hypothetical protein
MPAITASGRHTSLVAATVALIALALPGCSSDDDDATTSVAEATVASATPTNAAPTTAAPTTAAPTAISTTVASTSATSTPDASTSVSTGGDDEIATLPLSDEPRQLHTDEVVRYETEAGTFELAGQDGWVAFVTPVSVWFTTTPDLGRAWVSIVFLKDGHPELGPEGADVDAVAIAGDPRMPLTDLTLPDGTPNLAELRPLPGDWLGYLAGLPGVTLAEPAATTLGEIDGDAAAYAIVGVPEDPTAYCTNGLLTWIELHGSWCLANGESGTLMVAEHDGARFELNVGTDDRATPADEAALAAIVDTLRLV